jgi:glyoxylase-like metal-dependent hydrolase (beta-lactamase superfamily II)
LKTALLSLADGVWLLPHDPDPKKVQPSVGIICDSNQTVLIDAGNGSLHAQRIQAALKEIDAPPIRHIIYTHHHWDHVFGASYFDAPVIGHRLCQMLLSEQAAMPWGPDYLDAEIKQHPERAASYHAMQQANPDWQAFRIVVPKTTFTDRLTLPLDGLALELEHVGGTHTPDSIVVRAKEARILFVGDGFYPGWEVRRINWKMLAAFLADPTIDIFVSSHMHPLMRRELLKFMGVRALVGIMSQLRT